MDAPPQGISCCTLSIRYIESKFLRFRWHVQASCLAIAEDDIQSCSRYSTSSQVVAVLVELRIGEIRNSLEHVLVRVVWYQVPPWYNLEQNLVPLCEEFCWK
jgi:hypothetical protein